MRTPAFPSSAKAPILLLALLLLVAYLLYLPGLSGGFIFDDGGSITENEWIQIDQLTWNNLEGAASSFRGGPLGRPVAMVTKHPWLIARSKADRTRGEMIRSLPITVPSRSIAISRILVSFCTIISPVLVSR